MASRILPSCLFIIVMTTFGIPAPQAHAQVIEKWVARYEGTGGYPVDYARMAIGMSGNVYVAGWKVSDSYSLTRIGQTDEDEDCDSPGSDEEPDSDE
jgi:hypothetical protein